MPMYDDQADAKMTAVANASPKQNEVDRAMEYLQAQVSRASEMSSMLEGKLYSVLSPTTPSPGIDNAPRRGSEVPIADAICRLAGDLEVVLDDLSRVKDRIEV